MRRRTGMPPQAEPRPCDDGRAREDDAEWTGEDERDLAASATWRASARRVVGVGRYLDISTGTRPLAAKARTWPMASS